MPLLHAHSCVCNLLLLLLLLCWCVQTHSGPCIHLVTACMQRIVFMSVSPCVDQLSTFSQSVKASLSVTWSLPPYPLDPACQKLVAHDRAKSTQTKTTPGPHNIMVIIPHCPFFYTRDIRPRLTGQSRRCNWPTTTRTKHLHLARRPSLKVPSHYRSPTDIDGLYT
jgi:hypothetical protein